MQNKQIVIEYIIYEKIEKYNHQKFYEYTEDINGQLYQNHYAHDGDGDWYITCFENLETHENLDDIDVKYYYEEVGRVPYTFEKLDDLSKMVGRYLHKEIIEDKVIYGFIDYETNVFYVI